MKHAPVMEKEPRAEAAIRRWSELKQGERSDFERDWNDIARLIRPHRGGFGLDTPTVRQLEKPLSSAPIMAHNHFAAGIYAGITNPATRWGGLTTPDPDLNRWPPFAEWLDRTSAKIHNSFSPSLSSFYPASYQAYGDLAAFGNAAGYDALDQGKRKFIDVTVSLAEIVVSIDFHGRVVEVVRKMRLTPAQAAREFGRDALPAKVIEALDKSSTEKHVYFHHVLRNDDFLPGTFRLGAKGKQWLSHHVCEEGAALLRVKGFDEMPFYFPRWDVDSGFTYGIGPGFTALASARVNQRMEDAVLRAAQRAADPVKLAPDRNAVPLNGTWRPGATVYGAISPGGQRLVHTEDFVGNVGLTENQQRAKIEEVKEAFYYSVMSLTGRTGISDDENRVIEEARLRNWAPHADRIMEEYAARKFERRYMLLLRAGQIDPVPDGTPDGAALQIQYRSAAAIALQASQAQAVRQYVGDLLPVINIKPELRHRLDANAYAEILHEANTSLPQNLLVSREEAQAAAEAEAQQQQLAQAASLAQTGGQAARDIAQAAAAGQGGEGAQ